LAASLHRKHGADQLRREVHRDDPALCRRDCARAHEAADDDDAHPALDTEQVSNQVTRQQDDKELTSLVAWLTGGPDGKQFSETDQYGVVEFDMGVDYMTHVAAMMNIEAAMAGQPAEAILRRQVSMQQAMNERIKDGAQRSVALANERVLRALRNNYNYFYKQCQTNLENGMGKIIPSRSEVLAAVVLAEEVEKSTKAQQALMAKVQHIIDNKPTAGQ
jgi:hypothetical protein